MHIVHCNGNHYEALIYPGGRTINERLTRELAQQQMNDRSLIHIQSHDDPPSLNGEHSNAQTKKKKETRSQFKIFY